MRRNISQRAAEVNSQPLINHYTSSISQRAAETSPELFRSSKKTPGLVSANLCVFSVNLCEKNWKRLGTYFSQRAAEVNLEPLINHLPLHFAEGRRNITRTI
jgi:hypothetical protein